MLRSRAGNTRRAYGADWGDFAVWCADAGLEALPARPETVGLYLAARVSKHRPATLDRRLVAIAAAHRRLDPIRTKCEHHASRQGDTVVAASDLVSAASRHRQTQSL